MQVRGLGATAMTACILGFSSLLQAQRNDASGAAGCAACSGCGGLLILIWISLIGLQIALLIWVARDAKARGMDSAILWMLLVMFVPLLGIVIYIFARPQGNMVQCANCGNKRLQASVKCPHCGIGS
jgi:hypothetical protein